MLESDQACWVSDALDVQLRLPRPPEGSKIWSPLIIPQFPQCSNGFILGGFHFLDPLGDLG